MQYWKCKCGEKEYYESGMPPQPCVSCEKCGTTLAQRPDDHKEPIPHDPVTRYNQNTGEPYQECKRCYVRLPSA